MRIAVGDARSLFLAEGTVKNGVSDTLEKLGTRDRITYPGVTLISTKRALGRFRQDS